MKMYGLKIAQGADVQNLVIDVGVSFPSAPGAPPDRGELFYKSGSGEGLYVFTGTAWDAIGALDLGPELEALASVTSAADTIPYFTGSGAAVVSAFTSFGRQLVDDADQIQARATLGLGTAATRNTGTSGTTVPLLDGVNTWSNNQTFSGALIYGGITQASVQPATINGRFSRWNSTNSRYEQFDLFGTTNTWSTTQEFSAGINISSGILRRSVGAGLTAAGTTQATALALTSEINVVTTAAIGSGVILGNSIGGTFVVINTTAHALNVYPIASARIDSLTINAAFVLLAGSRLEFVQTSNTQYVTLNATYA